jgi:hypothetical protein
MLSKARKSFAQKINKQHSEQSLSFTIISTGKSKSLTSSAQQRIWLDEKVFHDPLISPALYHIIAPLTIKHGSLSIASIRSVIVTILGRNTILRTAVRLNEENGRLEQEVQPIIEDLNYSFEITYGTKSSEELDALLRKEFNTHFADFERGLVVRCHLIKMNVHDEENLHVGDLIIFVFHHIAFDMSSVGLFIDTLKNTFNSAEPLDSTLQYIDYAIYEHTLLVDSAEDSKMNQARRFWAKQMNGYDWNKKYSLFIGTTRNTKVRSGRGRAITFALDSDMVRAQTQYAISNKVSMFQLCLSCFFAYLYKLSNCSMDDFCVNSLTANRLLPETKTIIGMFVNVLPYRIKIDPTESFLGLLLRIHQLCIDVLEHAHLPYQEITSSMRNYSSPQMPFYFRYESTVSSLTYGSTTDFKLGNAIVGAYQGRDWSHSNGTAIHDLTLSMTHNYHDQTTHCVFEYSTDVYEDAMISLIARRFQHFLSQIFSTNVEKNQFNQSLEQISKLSILLPEDIEEIQRVVFYRLPNIVDTGMTFVKFLNSYISEAISKEGYVDH